ncbi:MAG: response regulator [Anaerolineales bacterium]|nr:response regulator [Anaerolineales bacterium]
MSRILVVDDEEAYRDLMAKHLERRGFTVDRAANGEEALSVLESSPAYDVLVTDLMMPRMGGLELLRKAKDHQPDLEVIVITASDDVANAITAMREDGAYDYLLKPLETISQLSFSVGRVIQHRTLKLEKEILHNQLEMEHDRLDALVRSTGDAIIAAGADGLINVVNPAARELLDGSIDVGDKAGEALPEILANLIENWTLMGPEQPSMVEINWPLEYVHNVSMTPFGSAGGWIMVLRDITHLRNLDDLKLRMLSEAAGRIRLPLAQAISKLAELNQTASGSADEINTTVYSLSTLLGKIQNWIDELLSLMRLEAGIGFERTELVLSDLFREDIVARFEETYRDRGLRLAVTTAEQLPEVRVDPRLMDKMFQALLNRAAERSSPGGLVRVRVSTRRSDVWIEVIDEGIYAENKRAADGVRDAGRAQLDGMSLEMVKAIVGSLGGQVWVQGRGRMGSTIALSLPAINHAGV